MIRGYEMSMPRFTAEASLFKSNEHYELIADKAQYLQRQEIIPQRMILYRGCLYDCDWFLRCHLYGCYA
jgi:hypothetical protein